MGTVNAIEDEQAHLKTQGGHQLAHFTLVCETVFDAVTDTVDDGMTTHCRTCPG